MSLNPIIRTLYASTIDDAVRLVSQLEVNSGNRLYFRGENTDFGITAFTPGIYRPGRLCDEHLIYREMQRFNDHEFTTDKTAFDKLARMQHYSALTRMLDLSEDMFSSLFFALDKRADHTESVLYAVELNEAQMKYYDSDAVSIIANLAKLPLHDELFSAQGKSKQALWKEAKEYLDDRDGYNANQNLPSKQFLLHDIKEEKSYFQDILDPKDIFRMVAVKPKLTSQRLQSQKGAFLLCGLNKADVESTIALVHAGGLLNPDTDEHPVLRMTKIVLSEHITIKQLEKLGISKSYIYPELESVSQYLTAKYT